jgi:hypothetical protein
MVRVGGRSTQWFSATTDRCGGWTASASGLCSVICGSCDRVVALGVLDGSLPLYRRVEFVAY